MKCSQKNSLDHIPIIIEERKNLQSAIMIKLEQALRSYGVQILSEFVSTSDIDQSEDDEIAYKSDGAFKQATTQLLADIHRVLSKQLTNSLEIIMK